MGAIDNNILDFKVISVRNPPWIPAAFASTYCLTTDPRLSDSRNPLPHTHPYSDITGVPAPVVPGVAVEDDGVFVGTRSRFNFVSGSNATLTVTDTGDKLNVQVDASAAGAPVGASYLVLGLDGTLTSERVLTAGTNVSFVDTGANGTLTINASAGASVVDDAANILANQVFGF
jgi:hypothetical protein